MILKAPLEYVVLMWAKKPPPMAAMFFEVSKEQSCEIISKSNKQFQRRKILKNFS